MNNDIAQIQETIGKVRAALTAISDIAYERIDFKPNDVYADHLLNMIDVASEYAKKVDMELTKLEEKK